MTKRMREGLGVLCLAAICLVIGIEGARAESESVADLGIGFGGLLALIGLVLLAVELFRKPDHTKSSSGERSSGLT